VASENWINPVYWSLGIEFQYYLLIGLIYPAFVGNKKLLNTLFLLVVTILCWAIFLILIKGTYLHYGSLIFQYFPVFIVGITIFQLKENLISKYSYVLINILIIGLCFTEFKLGVILAILFATIVLFLMKKSPKIFLFLGKISFSMYLLHVPLGGGFSKLIIPHVKDDSTRTILILLSVIPIIVISWLFYKIVEEPCISLSKRIKY
jgi:peptidoglycan/LPS O-acetylase OafA/YrhL